MSDLQWLGEVKPTQQRKKLRRQANHGGHANQAPQLVDQPSRRELDDRL
ncbi:hypothetical protein ACH347_34830 [Saccharopolyspora sp. 5N102]